MRKVYLTVLICITYLASFGAYAIDVSENNSDLPTYGLEESSEMEDVVVTCGSISAVRIYDQSTDQPVSGIDALYNGISINSNLLPSNYYIAVETFGTVGSVNIWIEGNLLNTENVAPFTYPGGGENDNNWNGGVGSYDLDAVAYLNDNADNQCASVWLEFHIVSGGGCDNVTNAGSVQGGFTACSSEDFTLVNSQSPSGGSGALEYVWLFNPNGPNLDSYTAISNSNTAELTTSNTQSGWYRRCARRAGCTDYAGESNWVEVVINGNCNTINPPSSPNCDAGAFLWENNIDVSTLNGSNGIPQADLRFVDYNVTQFSIPGPFPSEFNGSVVINSIEAISWDAYLTRPNTGDQPNEQWRVIFRNNGNTVYTSDYTTDLATGPLVAETTTNLGSNIELDGIDEIILAHYEDGTYGTSSSSSANSVVPVSICIDFSAGCENIAPTADNLDPEITSECGDDYPTVTFSDETSTATVTNYEEYPAAKSCEIDLSTYPAYQNTNIWFHAFNDAYDKHFEWNEGHVITLEDNTVKLIGRVQNVNDANSGFLLEFYFEALQDQATFVAAGGYNSTDADAADRLYANVDFSKPNSIIGFGAFADADLELTNTGNVNHMDIGPRNVYGGYGFGFWIDYVGTVNGVPVGNSATNTGGNHIDMYSALNVCYENDNDCEDFIIREWTVEDECGNADIFVQHVNVIDTEAPNVVDVENMTVQCEEALPNDEPTFTDACDNDLEIEFSEASDVNAAGLTVITRTWTATDDCGNSSTSSYTITILACTNVGDTVWYDNDRDGIQDADENGVEGVTVNLIGPGPDGLFHTADDEIVATETTDANGNYLFEGVVPGDYCIEFIEGTLPADYIFTAQNEGGDDAEDSDADADGKTGSFTVTTGQDDDLTWDAGIYTCTDITVTSNDPQDLTVECGDDVPAAVEPGFSDPVDNDLEVVFTESEDTNECESTITRSWTATNDCGNTLTVDQLITIVDTTAPTLEDAPTNEEYECIDDVPAPQDMVAIDNCDDNPVIAYDESNSGDNCEGAITRTWTVTDDCDNVTVYTQIISISDDVAPVVDNTPADVTIECSDALPTDEATFSDNCDDDLTISMVDTESGDGCPLVITRTWTATDDCGNEVSTSQTITINDTTAPDASDIPQDVTVECDQALPTDEPTFTDNCDDNLVVELTEVETALDCQYELVRTWTATDDCGNAESVSQTITIADTTAPTLDGVPANLMLECADEVPAPANPTPADNCDASPVVSYDETSEINGCEVTITRTWTVTDACDNITSYMQMISIIDETSPAVSDAPADVTIECSDALPTDEPSFTDNCDDDLAIEMTEVESGNGCPLVITRTWTATDDCGNTESVSQNITLIDGTAPVVTDAPADLSIECSDALPNDEPSFTDNCDDDLTIDFNEVQNALDCQYELVRTWTATDDCGNSESVTQTITLTDATAPTLEGVPANAEFECSSDVPAAADVTANDNCDDTPEVSFEELVEGDDCNGTITRTWTVSDDCDNVTVYTQVITIADDIAPIVGSTPADVAIECSDALPTDEATFSDNCDDDLTVTMVDSESGDGCPLVITRTWTATDDCGNEVSTSQTITINDSTAPEASNVPAAVTVQCDQELPTDEPSFEDNCDDNLVVELTEVENTLSCQYELVRTWTATDDCGNETSVSQTITVTDATAPTLVGVPANMMLECADDVPAPAEPTPADNCDPNPVVNFSETSEINGCEVTLTRTWTVTDACDNVTSYLQMISIIDETAPEANNIPTDATVSCDDEMPTDEPTFTDNCDEDLNVEFSESSEYNAEGVQEITRTWTATDDCGNDITVSQLITVLPCTNIGDTVWYDVDQDGIQDDDEAGVEGVTVNLIGPGPDGLFHTDDDEIVATETTDENGNYLFEEVYPGDYCIEFVEGSIPADFIFTSSNEGGDDAVDSDSDEEGKTEMFTVEPGQVDDLTFDAGIYNPVNIGDTVFYDVDQDGIQDADEAGVEGVTVNLIGPGPDGLFHTDDDEIVATDTTDENGNYLFEEVVAGTYCIEFVEGTIPADFIFTASNEGGDDAADSDADAEGKTEAFTVEANQEDDLTFDAGIFDPINIGDTVFNDLDQDGIQDAGEPGVEGVTVNLIGPGPDGLFHTDDDEIVATETTDENGNYLFEEVAPGTYCIEFVEATLPVGTEFTASNEGGDDAADSDADAEGKTEAFTVEAGQEDDLTFDAGIFDPINIGDTVFNDLDQDGIQDAGEPGVEGVTVNLIGPGPDGLFHTDDDEIVATETTDENGNYLFEEVAPGTYCIEFVEGTIPADFIFTASNEGGDDAADSDADAEGKTEAFTIEAGQEDDLTFDAGIFDPINIGDTVFNDLDQDGIQDAGEPGVEGVTVNLIGPGPDGLFHTDDDEIVATETTDENGNYLFEEVAPGTYCIEFVEGTIPADFIFTASNEGGDDAADSDADAEGKTEAFTIEAGQDDDLTFDAGIFDPINIGDTVFNDLDQDGIQDAGEPGVEGITVNLIGPGPDGLFHTDDDEIVATETTDENGNYLFEEVAPGTYCIEFVAGTLPTGSMFTDANQGGGRCC